MACASTGASSTSTSTSTSYARVSVSDSDGVAPAGPGAKHYAPSAGADGRAPLPPDGLRRALLAEVRAAARKLGKPAPEPDARLDWAMTELARQVRGDDLPALDVLEFLLAHYGLVEPSPHILMSGASSHGEAELAAHARAEITEMLRTADIRRVGIGIDRSGDMTHVVLGLQEKHVDVARGDPAAGRRPEDRFRSRHASRPASRIRGSWSPRPTVRCASRIHPCARA